ncbi:unnamed protein product [Prorocentrum cordatum]|uniref:Methyltransferase domain-containing protein n=1 Tax=Prorocentrum cordatum TaxID=2364126 RepID=A0ABN9XGL0_9DINO|nr:unnamed protein product [Polarella glacialis]
MDVSIPGRYGFRRRSEQREAALDLVWRRVGALVEAEVAQALPQPPCDARWREAPAGLDPAEGELDEARAARKRDQVVGVAAYAMEAMPLGARVVEFGAGSGHLGVLLAHLRPDASVVLVECKDYSVPVARQRIRGLGLGNCEVFHGTVDAFAASGAPFDLAVGLHTCGLLADAVLALAVKRGAAACLVPCCYGQVASVKQDHQRGEGTAALMHPCSTVLRSAIGEDGREADKLATEVLQQLLSVQREVVFLSERGRGEKVPRRVRGQATSLSERFCRLRDADHDPRCSAAAIKCKVCHRGCPLRGKLFEFWPGPCKPRSRIDQRIQALPARTPGRGYCRHSPDDLGPSALCGGALDHPYGGPVRLLAPAGGAARRSVL